MNQPYVNHIDRGLQQNSIDVIERHTMTHHSMYVMTVYLYNRNRTFNSSTLLNISSESNNLDQAKIKIGSRTLKTGITSKKHQHFFSYFLL